MAALCLGEGRASALVTLSRSSAGVYGPNPRSFLLSAALHAAAVALVLLLARQFFTRAGLPPAPPVVPRLYFAGSGGGGGSHQAVRMPKGDLPNVNPAALARPVIVVPVEHPSLPVEAGVDAAPDLKLTQTGKLGDPWASLIGPPSNGTGRDPGAGDGEGPSWGHGHGRSLGPGSSMFPSAGHVTAPRALFAPDPDYTDLARQNRLQGTVTLWVVVSADGTTQDIRVARTLGLGLDQRAVEAVRRWRFAPGAVDGKPVPVRINVEVNFRLY
jgi:TonB family protein